eukprot:15036-Heterococcus_DN1.PRE.2
MRHSSGERRTEPQRQWQSAAAFSGLVSPSTRAAYNAGTTDSWDATAAAVQKELQRWAAALSAGLPTLARCTKQLFVH